MSIFVKDLVTELPKSPLPAGYATEGAEFTFFISGPKPLACDNNIVDGEAIVFSTGGNAAVHYGKGKFSYSTDCWALQPIEKDIEGKYLYYFLSSQIARIDALGFEGSGLKHLRKDFVRNYKVPNLSKPEQSRIAIVLSRIDQAIEQTESLINKQQHIKIGLMQDLLTHGIDEHGNLRSEETHKFKNSPLGRIPVEWEVSFVKNLCSQIVDCPHTTPTYLPAGIPCIRTADMIPGQLLLEQAFCVSEKEYISRTARLTPQKGDIIYSREGERLGIASPVGREKICLGQRVMLLRPKNNPDYLLWAMNNPSFYNRIITGLGATTSPHINVGDIKKALILRPTPEEQTAIGQLLSSQTEYLNSIKNQIEKLKRLKTALMQDLLTGKKRVAPLLEEMEAH
jgi:type I restriction enzyme S subunit